MSEEEVTGFDDGLDAGADEFDDAIEAALRAAAGTTEATPAVPGGYIDGETLQEANELRQEQEQAAAAAAADANYEAAATSGGDNDAAYVVPETAKESGAYVDGETLQAAGEVAAGELPTAGKAFIRRQSEVTRVRDIAAVGGGDEEFEAFDGQLQNLTQNSGVENLATKLGIEQGEVELHMSQAIRETEVNNATRTSFSNENVVRSAWKIATTEAGVVDDLAKDRKHDLAHKLSKECDKGRNTYLAVAKRPSNITDLLVLKYKDKHQVPDAPPHTIRDKAGATALHVAGRHGNLAMVQWLVELGMDLRVKAGNGATAAHDAAATGNLPCLQCLIYHCPELKTMAMDRDNGLLPIHMAALFGKTDILKWLVEEGSWADLFVPAADGCNCMHYAAALGHRELLEYLVSAKGGSDAASKINSAGLTPLAKAAEGNQLECAKLMLSQGAGRKRADAPAGIEPGHAAAKMGALATLMYLVELNPGVLEERNSDGATVVHYAASAGQEGALAYIVGKLGGLSEAARAQAMLDDAGRTAAHHAASNGQQGSLRVLSDRNMALSTADKTGKTPADVARENDRTECAIFLALKSNDVHALLKAGGKEM